MGLGLGIRVGVKVTVGVRVGYYTDYILLACDGGLEQPSEHMLELGRPLEEELGRSG